jgi:hypothetical protein
MGHKEEEQGPRPVFGMNARGLTEEEEKLWWQSHAPEHRDAIIKMRNERDLKRREREAWPKTRVGQLL